MSLEDTFVTDQGKRRKTSGEIDADESPAVAAPSFDASPLQIVQQVAPTQEQSQQLAMERFAASTFETQRAKRNRVDRTKDAWTSALEETLAAMRDKFGETQNQLESTKVSLAQMTKARDDLTRESGSANEQVKTLTDRVQALMAEGSRLEQSILKQQQESRALVESASAETARLELEKQQLIDSGRATEEDFQVEIDRLQSILQAHEREMQNMLMFPPSYKTKTFERSLNIMVEFSREVPSTVNEWTAIRQNAYDIVNSEQGMYPAETVEIAQKLVKAADDVYDSRASAAGGAPVNVMDVTADDVDELDEST